jgi:hypothetical protein
LATRFVRCALGAYSSTQTIGGRRGIIMRKEGGDYNVENTDKNALKMLAILINIRFIFSLKMIPLIGNNML